MTEKEKKREFFDYSGIPCRQTFTYDGCSVVFYEDTEKGEKRTFHSYMGGYLYRSESSPPKSRNDFYTCDIHGNYIPLSLVRTNVKLRKELVELKKACEFKTKLTVF